MFDQEFTRLRAPLVASRLGTKVPDWPNAAELLIEEVSVQPNKTSESTTDARDQNVVGWRIRSRAGVDLDIKGSDRVKLENGAVCEVIGEIGRWPHPIKPGAVHHVEFDVQRVTG